jgi:nucleoside-diphosphate-sugar epimerase
MKKAIVFGASGLVGSHLMELLIKDNKYDKIVLFNRHQISVNSSKVEEQIINFDELDKISDEITGDVVFCTLGSTIKKAKTIENFVKIDYNLPLEIAQRSKNNNVKSFVIVTSIGSNPKSKNYYTKTKGRLEEALNELNFENLKIVRPSMLLGNRDEFRFFEIIGKFMAKLLGFLLIGKLKKYRAIHAKDVANAMIKISENNKSKIIFESHELKKISRDE